MDPLARDRLVRDQPDRGRTRWGSAANGPAPFLGRVATATPEAGKFVVVNPVIVLGPETPGGAGALSVSTSNVIAYPVGGRVPVFGDDLVVHWSDHRWTIDTNFNVDDDDTIYTPHCPCTSTPAVLTMTSSHPTSNGGIFQNATIEYQAIPAALLPLGLGAFGYLSNAQYQDTASGDWFRYSLGCQQSYYVLTRVYEESVEGSPHRDIVRYRWTIGAAGNTCTPFALTNGVIFAGGDPTCIVTITG